MGITAVSRTFGPRALPSVPSVETRTSATITQMKILVLALACSFASCVSPAFAQTNAPASARTVIHPGDMLNVQVFGDTTLSQNVMVLADGTVDYTLIGRVPVGGRTPSEAASALSNRLLRYVRHPVVTVSIATLGQPSVLVLGDVKNPGKYSLRSDGRLTDAIAAAGGLAEENGSLPDARVSDSAGQVSTVSLQQLLRQGQTALDKPLGEGSVVYVPGATHFTVDVSGAVDHPGDVQVSDGDRLSVAIAKAGNSANAQSDLNHIKLIRVNAAGAETTQDVNLYQAINEGDSSADVSLKKGDIVYVPQAKSKSQWAQSPLLYFLTRLVP
jgi:polysaccharide biosynthesis/export protein